MVKFYDRNQVLAVEEKYPPLLYGAWLVLSVLAVLYADQRILYQDSAFTMFKLVNLELPVEHYRWGTIILLIPSWICAAVGLPLSLVFAVFSLSSIAVPYFTSKLIYKWVPDNYLYILPLFIPCSLGAEWYFMAMAEMVPALCYGLLFAALAFRLETPYSSKFTLSIVFLVLAFVTHPASLLFCALSVALLYTTGNKKHALRYAGIVFLAVLLKKYALPSSAYEAEYLGRGGLQAWLDIDNNWTLEWVKGGFLKRFTLPTLVFCCGIILQSKGRKAISQLPVLGAMIFLFLLVVVIYQQGDSDLMMEKNFAPLLLFAFMPFFYLNHSGRQIRLTMVMLSLLIVSLGLVARFQHVAFYSERLKNLDALILRHTNERAFVSDTAFESSTWGSTWALPYETILRSSQAKAIHNASKTINNFKGTQADSAKLATKGMFYGAEFAYPLTNKQLNTRYYKLSDSGTYKADLY
jgi:hypothetical protein